MHRKKLNIHSRKNIGSELVGKFKSAFLGHGIEFRDFREYSGGDDAKYIDWIASSKEQALVMRRYQEERDATLHLVVDESYSIACDNSKLSLKNLLTKLIAESCIQSGISFTGWRIGEEGPHIICNKNPYVSLEQLQLTFPYKPRKDEMFSLIPFVSKKRKKSIYIIVSDSLEIDTSSLKALSYIHDVVYLYISTRFENTLSGTGIRALTNISGATINLGNVKQKEKYIELRQNQLRDFKSQLHSYKIRVGLFETGSDPIPELIRTLDTHF